MENGNGKKKKKKPFIQKLGDKKFKIPTPFGGHIKSRGQREKEIQDAFNGNF